MTPHFAQSMLRGDRLVLMYSLVKGKMFEPNPTEGYPCITQTKCYCQWQRHIFKHLLK